MDSLAKEAFSFALVLFKKSPYITGSITIPTPNMTTM